MRLARPMYPRWDMATKTFRISVQCRTTMYKIHVGWEGMDRGWPLGGGDIEGSIHGMGGKMVGSV